MLLVDLNDGVCRSCQSQLRIIAADDATLTVECTNGECADAYCVEPDAFGDGGMKYWPQAMAHFGEETWE
ncbi:MAG: hypothetical protein KDA80_13980 [Planctomycetaceae bacterium]|nr:hypothetical protein [Planctomycetaceae bacterium]